MGFITVNTIFSQYYTFCTLQRLTVGISSRMQRILEYLTDSLRSVKSSFRQALLREISVHFSRVGGQQEGNAGASDVGSHCDFSVRSFLSRDCPFVRGIEVCGGCFAHGHSRVRNATGIRVLINGKSTGRYTQSHKFKRRAIDEIRE